MCQKRARAASSTVPHTHSRDARASCGTPPPPLSRSRRMRGRAWSTPEITKVVIRYEPPVQGYAAKTVMRSRMGMPAACRRTTSHSYPTLASMRNTPHPSRIRGEYPPRATHTALVPTSYHGWHGCCIPLESAHTNPKTPFCITTSSCRRCARFRVCLLSTVNRS